MRALIAPANIIIMDEPTAGSDNQLKNKVMEIIRKHTVGKILILITHDNEIINKDDVIIDSN